MGQYATLRLQFWQPKLVSRPSFERLGRLFTSSWLQKAGRLAPYNVLALDSMESALSGVSRLGVLRIHGALATGGLCVEQAAAHAALRSALGGRQATPRILWRARSMPIVPACRGAQRTAVGGGLRGVRRHVAAGAWRLVVAGGAAQRALGRMREGCESGSPPRGPPSPVAWPHCAYMGCCADLLLWRPLSPLLVPAGHRRPLQRRCLRRRLRRRGMRRWGQPALRGRGGGDVARAGARGAGPHVPQRAGVHIGGSAGRRPRGGRPRAAAGHLRRWGPGAGRAGARASAL